LALPTIGESWHNNHHASQWSASFSNEWWQVDLGAAVVRAMEWTGLVREVRRATAADRQRASGRNSGEKAPPEGSTPGSLG
jgi:stearoyl-CoA desaturase (delta-9 desaturase)